MHPNISGMRDFFGGKMGRFVGKHLGGLSPISLAENEARTKLRTAVGKNLMRTGYRPEAKLGTGKGFWRGASDVMDYGRERYDQTAGAYSLGDYFTGKNFADVMPGARPLDDAIRKRRMMTRLAVPGIIGGGAVLDATIGDNPVSNLGRGALTGGGVMASGALMSRFGGAAGTVGTAALFGYSAINAIRGGDQLGPF